MAQEPEKKLRSERTRIETYGKDGTLPRETTDALLEWSSALHPEETEFEYVTPAGEQKQFAIHTVETYLREMRKVAERALPYLLDMDPSTFDAAIEAMRTGENPHVKDGGLTTETLSVTQSAARNFVWYFGIASPEEISVYTAVSDPMHDETDVLTQEDIEALRSHVEGARNRALLEMFLNTGQRISAIQGLRIRDVDTDAGWFSLNTERGGLKGAERRGQRRPLLGAAPFLNDWLDKHPRADNPDAYVFVGDPDHHYTKLDEPLCQGTIRQMLETTAERAGVDKPVNPHNFRHTWTTMMKQDYGLNDEEIKFLLGHIQSGNGMNRVYNHTTDTNLRANTMRKLREESDWTEGPLTPETCVTCSEDLDAEWLCCPFCGTAYGPR